MDPSIAVPNLTGPLDTYTYTPFIADNKWYTKASEKSSNEIYMYKAADNGITITRIRKYDHETLPYLHVNTTPSTPNAITVYFPSTVNEGLSPFYSTTEHLIFDMDPATQIPQIMTLLSIARSDDTTKTPEALVNQLITTNNQSPIFKKTPSESQTALSDPLLRELLLLIALRSFTQQGYHLAPASQDLIKAIASFGPPVVPHGTPFREGPGGTPLISLFHRNYIWKDDFSRWEFSPKGLRLRRDVEAVLVRNGWRDPRLGLERIAPPVWDKEDTTSEIGEIDEGDMSARFYRDRKIGVVNAAKLWDSYKDVGITDLVDALLSVGYLDSGDRKGDVLVRVARYGLLGDVEFTVGKIERDGISVGRECEILPAACEGGKGRADVLRFLLDKGLDPNALSSSRGEGTGKRTALHLAIRHGDVDMVRVLLEGGAKMVKDEEWGLPIEAAEGLADRVDGTAKVELIEKWLEERGLPRDHVDLPVFVDDDAGDSEKKRTWAVSSGQAGECRRCKTCGTRSEL